MARPVGRDEVREMVGRGVALIEVLPRAEYEREHIRGALSMPLSTLDDDASAQLARDAAIIVYCHDFQ
jgi:rhodanese-related sulfurtransferase